MPEVRRGSARGHSDSALSTSTASRLGGTTPAITVSSTYDNDMQSKDGDASNGAAERAVSDSQLPTQASMSTPGAVDAPAQQRRQLPPLANPDSRRSLSYALRPQAEAYYDSRAATRTEWRRRAKTLDEYYDDNRHLLPQLPFTWHHGRRRWRLFFFAFLVFVDASAVPIALYYGMRYAGKVQDFIIFAVVTTIWGGPTYLEFGVRTLRLMKRERFLRPLGTESRWCFDLLNWTSVLTITAVTALFIVGSAPHNVWLRVLCMPAPAILYCIGGVLAFVTLFHQMGWPAPFRISSTGKGEKVRRPSRLFPTSGITDETRRPGPAMRLLLCRGRHRRQRRRGPPVPRSPRRPVQGQPALPTHAVRAEPLLGDPVAPAGGGAHGGGGDSASAGDWSVRRVLGGAVPVDGRVGGHHGVVVQEGDGAGEARVGGRQRRGEQGRWAECRGGTGGHGAVDVTRRSLGKWTGRA